MYLEGRLVTLDEILHVIDGQEVDWRLIDFEAIALPDSGLDVLSLERAVFGSGEGLLFTYDALLELAQGLDQVINCEILGFVRGAPEMAGEAVVILQALDSTEWVLAVDEPQARLDLDSPLLRG